MTAIGSEPAVVDDDAGTGAKGESTRVTFQIPSTTDWIVEALGHQPDLGAVTVGGAQIAFRTWGQQTGRDVMLVHGGGAHSGWWDHIGPLLAERGRVAALDLSGHGDSDHRGQYDMAQWGAEVLEVRRAAGLGPACTVVGHSLGGLITLYLRDKEEAGVDRAIVVDSPIGGPEAQKLPEAGGFVSRRRLYPSREQAMARFRPVPAQASLPEVHEHVASDSVRQKDGGWTWKFDAGIFGGAARMRTTLPRPGGRLAYLRGEIGMVRPAVRSIIEQAGGICLDLPGAGHAPMLDQPAALVASLRAVIAGWDQRS
ncbi:alpha/beta fold hydrolase [Citricoccus parietis]|uniref:Alpha/beta fold hydrolase n=2 Tax=Citricoccus parietis TaxID=592307 RepID=A0ABV6F909_9MICC